MKASKGTFKKNPKQAKKQPCEECFMYYECPILKQRKTDHTCSEFQR